MFATIFSVALILYSYIVVIINVQQITPEKGEVMVENGQKKREETNREYDFIKERIKDKPLNRKRVLQRILLTVVLAVIFGAVSCFVFVELQPTMEKWLADTDKEEEEQVTIPQDEVEEEKKEEEPEVIIETQQLETSDYQALYTKLYAIGKKANRSVVTVTGVTNETDWAEASYESEGYASGLIVAKNRKHLMILTDYETVSDAQKMEVTFVDGSTVNATLKKYDANTGLAILNVSLEQMQDSTQEAVEVAQLGNSYQISQGRVVLAIGSPLGGSYSVLPGTITSTGNEISTVDHLYTEFTTDMTGSTQGSGALINLDGEVIGIIRSDDSTENGLHTISALSVSELKPVIEALINGEDLASLGVHITTVTDDIAEKYELPTGVYVKSVELDSAAFEAGIQTGDVITAVNGIEMKSVDDFENWIGSALAGSTAYITLKRYGSGSYKEVSCSAVLSGKQDEK
jgi:serine protease Do